MIELKENMAMASKDTGSRPIMTIKETAREYGFPEYALRSLVKSGAFPVIQSGKRSYIVRERFEEYLKTGGNAYVSAR